MFLDVRIRGESISVSRVIHISLQANLCSINLVCICCIWENVPDCLLYHLKDLTMQWVIPGRRWHAPLIIWCSTSLGYRTTKLHGPLWRQAWVQMMLYRFLPDLYHKSPWYSSLVVLCATLTFGNSISLPILEYRQTLVKSISNTSLSLQSCPSTTFAFINLVTPSTSAAIPVTSRQKTILMRMDVSSYLWEHF